MTILTKLFGRKTAADFSDAIAGLAAEKAVITSKVSDLRRQATEAPFERDVDVSALSRQIRELSDESDAIDQLVVETRTRLEAAESDEAKQRATKLLDPARKARAEMRKAAEEFDRGLRVMIDAMNDMRRHYLTVETVNASVVAAGFPNMALNCPMFQFEVGENGERSAQVGAMRSYARSGDFAALEARGEL